MVGVYYSWEYIVNMCDSVKTAIISVASENGDYIKKHLNLNLNLNLRISYDQAATTQGKLT